MDRPRTDRFDEDDSNAPPVPTQAELEAMFDADDADVERGLSVPTEPVLAEMRAVAAHIRGERNPRKTIAPQPR